MKHFALVAVVGLISLCAVACSGPDLDAIAPVPATNVAVRDNDFESPVIEVAAGQTVTWTWQGNNSHNVVGDGWSSKVIKDGRFEHTFSNPGTFDYRCTLHMGMTGRVIVTE